MNLRSTFPQSLAFCLGVTLSLSACPSGAPPGPEAGAPAETPKTPLVASASDAGAGAAAASPGDACAPKPTVVPDAGDASDSGVSAPQRNRIVLDLRKYTDYGARPVTPLIASHQTVVAFPLDPTRPFKEIITEHPDELLEIPTKAPCGEGLDPAFVIGALDSPVRRAALGIGMPIHVHDVTIEMPYESTPPDGFRRGPGVFCFGYRTTDGLWHWNLTPRRPRNDDANRLGTGAFTVAATADAIAILFHNTSHVREIAVSIDAPPTACGHATCPSKACVDFCEARQDHIKRCGDRALIKETLAECLATQVHDERCPTDRSRGGWLTAACMPEPIPPPPCREVKLDDTSACVGIDVWKQRALSQCAPTGNAVQMLRLEGGCDTGLFTTATAECCGAATEPEVELCAQHALTTATCEPPETFTQQAHSACRQRGGRIHGNIALSGMCVAGHQASTYTCCVNTLLAGKN